MSSILLVHTHTHTRTHGTGPFGKVCPSVSFTVFEHFLLHSFTFYTPAEELSQHRVCRLCFLLSKITILSFGNQPLASKVSLSPPLSSSQASDFSLSSDFISPKDIQDRRTDIDGAAFLAEIGTMDSIGLSSHLVCSSIGNDQQSKNKHFVACRQLRPTLNMQAIQSSPPSGRRDFQ